MAMAIVAFMLLIPVPAQAQRATAQRAMAAGSAAGPPLDIVLLVDESGSLSDTDVAREVQAAGILAQSPLNPRSRVTIIGFGGVNGVAPDQDPTSVVCQPTVTGSTASLQYLARCVSGLHRRTEAEGDDTDYAAALAQAMNVLGDGTSDGQQSPAGATKAIFMMTDGGLDLHRDPQYLPDWVTAAHHAVDLQLQAARASDVQVWPLGFGSIDQQDHDYLGYLAAQGAQPSHDSCQISRPHAIVVYNSTVALTALGALYAAAGCSGTSDSGPATLGPGQSRTLSVTIPAIASAGAISVTKGNPAIRVDYVTPGGTTVTGTALDGSTFQRSGQDTAVDVLHVTDPAAGTWQIRLTAPPDMGSQLVSATAFWQGAVRAVITASPPTARDGQPVKVVVSVLGIRGPITDPATLQQLRVSVNVTGDGLPGPVDVPVSNAGEGTSTPTGAGDYDGTYTAPGRAGTLMFTGTAQGYGLVSTKVPTQVQVGTQPPSLQATILFNAPISVQAGQRVSGQILFSNQTGTTQHVRLELDASPAFATITSPEGTLPVPSGNSPAAFTVTFRPDSPRGNMLLRASVVDAAHPGTVYGNSPLTIAVTAPPGILARYGWAIVAAIIVLAIIALIAAARRRVRRKRTAVSDLTAVLRRDGEVLYPTLKASGRWSDSFRFVIRGEDGPDPRLAHPRSGDRTYVARRADHGRIKVLTPGGEKFEVSPGRDGEPLPNGLTLSFADARVPSSRVSRDEDLTDTGRPGGSGQAWAPSPRNPDQGARPSEPVAPAPSSTSHEPDEWM